MVKEIISKDITVYYNKKAAYRMYAASVWSWECIYQPKKCDVNEARKNIIGNIKTIGLITKLIVTHGLLRWRYTDTRRLHTKYKVASTVIMSNTKAIFPPCK